MFLFWLLPTTFSSEFFCLKESLGLKFEKTILPLVPTTPGLPYTKEWNSFKRSLTLSSNLNEDHRLQLSTSSFDRIGFIKCDVICPFHRRKHFNEIFC